MAGVKSRHTAITAAFIVFVGATTSSTTTTTSSSSSSSSSTESVGLLRQAVNTLKQALVAGNEDVKVLADKLGPEVSLVRAVT